MIFRCPILMFRNAVFIFAAVFVSSCSNFHADMSDKKDITPKVAVIYGDPFPNDSQNPYRPNFIKKFEIKEGTGDKYELEIRAYKIYCHDSLEITVPKTRKELDEMEKKYADFILNKSTNSMEIREHGGANIVDFPQVIPYFSNLLDSSSGRRSVDGYGICAAVTLDKSKMHEGEHDLQLQFIYKSNLLKFCTTYNIENKVGVVVPNIFREDATGLDWSVTDNAIILSELVSLNSVKRFLDDKKDKAIEIRVFLLFKKI